MTTRVKFVVVRNRDGESYGARTWETDLVDDIPDAKLAAHLKRLFRLPSGFSVRTLGIERE